MNIVESTTAYEAWLKMFMHPIPSDVRLKHIVMSRDPYTFFRATFYRWAQIWPELPPPIADAPRVLAIGDTHVENFGTWRDREGRLVWGVNDFDESGLLPYTNDIVRLAVSGLLAKGQGLVKTNRKSMLAAMLLGYRTALTRGGSPFVIEGRNVWLGKLVESGARSPKDYWDKVFALAPWRGAIPKRAAKLIADVPGDARELRIIHRISGAGSLGRPRLAALFEWRGGYLAREAKARAPSAWTWATSAVNKADLTALPMIWRRAIRCPDPYLTAKRHWIARRLAPDCSRIDLADLPKKRQEIALFCAMGWEVGNIHLGFEAIDSVRHHLSSLHPSWLDRASDFMHAAVLEDFRRWKSRR